MYQFIIALLLLTTAKALGHSLESSDKPVVLAKAQDVSYRKLFRRTNPPRDVSPSSNQSRNKRPRPASSTSPNVSQDRKTRRLPQQSNSSHRAERNQPTNVSPAASLGHDLSGGAIRSSSPASPEPRGQSQNHQELGSVVSLGHSRLSRSSYDRTPSSSSVRSQSSAGSHKTSSLSRAESFQTPSQLDGEVSSVPSSPRRAHPVSVSTLTKGPATVASWEGRSRRGGLAAIDIGEGQWKMTEASDPRLALIATTHHSDKAETYAYGTGRRAGVRTHASARADPATRITVPHADGTQMAYIGGSMAHKSATDDIESGAHIIGSLKGSGRLDIEAKNPGPDSDSELTY